MKIFNTILLSLMTGAASALVLAPDAQASCYGSGYTRFCDGIGGSGATYTPVPRNGMTDYTLPGGGRKSVRRTTIGDSDYNTQSIETYRY